jgi:hypothetical protein
MIWIPQIASKTVRIIFLEDVIKRRLANIAKEHRPIAVIPYRPLPEDMIHAANETREAVMIA